MTERTARHARTLALLTTAVGVALSLAAAPLPRVERDGTGERRDKLDAIEYAPFNFDKFALLSDWSSDEPITAESVKGKVLLVVRWNAGDPAAIRFMPKVSRALRRFGQDNVAVLIAHGDQDWDEAQARHERGQVPGTLALDAQHVFKNTFHADGNADIYLVDRAGRLRYADLNAKSFERALSALVRETSEEAARTTRDEEPAAHTRPSRDERDTADSDAATPEIDPALYLDAPWPAKNTGNLYASDIQGNPVSLTLGSEVMLTPDKPLSRDKVTVVDFWATWCGPCHAIVPTLDRLQASLPNDLQILGIAGQRDSENDVRQFLQREPSNFTQIFDQRQQLYRQIGVNGIPHVLVVSTDGVVRWQGNPHDRAFVPAVMAVVDADPMIKSRRASDGRTGANDE